MKSIYINIVFICVILLFITNLKLHSQTMNWKDVGIKNSVTAFSGIGRIDYIAFDPNHADTLFVCSPWGGVFISKDRGNSWSSIGLEFKVEQPASSCIYIDADDNTSSTWYVASGNADGPHLANYQRESNGIYRTRDRGATWLNIGPHIKETCNAEYYQNKDELAICGYLINDIIRGPDSREHLLISTTCGIYETKNALAPSPDWTNIIPGNFGSLVSQPGQNNIIFCAENFVIDPRIIRCNLNTYDTEEINYSSEIDVTNENVRIILRFSKNEIYSNNLFVFFNDYEFVDNNTDGIDDDHYEGYAFLYKILSNEFVPKGDMRLGGINRYDAIHISDTNAGVVFAPTQGGKGISKPTKAINGLIDSEYLFFNENFCGTVHLDQHHITQSPHDSSLWVANDGGVYVLEENHCFYEKMDGLAVSTIDDFDVAQLADEIRYVAGYQDMGSQITYYDEFQNTEQSIHYFGLDGDWNFFDPNNFNLFTSRNGNEFVTWREIDPLTKVLTTIGEAPFRGELYFDKTNPGVTYNVINNELIRSDDRGITNTEVWCPYDNIKTFAISPTNPNVMYCFSNESSDGKSVVYKSEGGGGNDISRWQTIKYGTADMNVSIAVVDYDNPDHLWIGSCWPSELYSFNSKTLELSTFPKSWSAPIIETIKQEYNSNQGLYILINSGSTGSDVYTENIYYTDLSMDYWDMLKEGLPNIRYTGLEINQEAQDIYAGTYGRGMWKSPLYCSAEPGDFNTPSFFINHSKHMEGKIIADGVIGGLVTLRAGEEIIFEPGFQTLNGTDFTAITRPCGSSSVFKKSMSPSSDNLGYKENMKQRKEEVNDKRMFDIYPNPSNGLFFLSSPIEDEEYSIYISNMLGEIIFEERASGDKIEIDLTSYPEGMYVVIINSGEEIYSAKLIKR